MLRAGALDGLSSAQVLEHPAYEQQIYTVSVWGWPYSVYTETRDRCHGVKVGEAKLLFAVTKLHSFDPQDAISYDVLILPIVRVRL